MVSTNCTDTPESKTSLSDSLKGLPVPSPDLSRNTSCSCSAQTRILYLSLGPHHHPLAVEGIYIRMRELNVNVDGMYLFAGSRVCHIWHMLITI